MAFLCKKSFAVDQGWKQRKMFCWTVVMWWHFCYLCNHKTQICFIWSFHLHLWCSQQYFSVLALKPHVTQNKIEEVFLTCCHENQTTYANSELKINRDFLSCAGNLGNNVAFAFGFAYCHAQVSWSTTWIECSSESNMMDYKMTFSSNVQH